MATATSRSEVLQQGYDPGRRWSWAAMLVAVLVSLAVGLGVGWLAFASDEGGQATRGQAAEEPDAVVKQEALSMISAYVAAWNAGNGRGVVSLMGDSGVVGVVRPAEFRGWIGWRPLRSDVTRWQVGSPAERRELVKVVEQAEGMFGEQYEITDVLWLDESDNTAFALDRGEAWVLISGRYATPVNPFYNQVIRFTFGSGDALGRPDAGPPTIRSVEHVLRGPTADFLGL